jgi:hypothetical protein
MPTIAEVVRQHPCRYCGKKEVRLKQMGTEPVVYCRSCHVEGPLGIGLTEEEAWQAWNAPGWLLKLFKAPGKL